jgi:hypothetical protein
MGRRVKDQVLLERPQNDVVADFERAVAETAAVLNETRERISCVQLDHLRICRVAAQPA